MSDVVFDRAAAYPAIGAFRAAVTRRDWTAGRELLLTVPPALRTAMLRDGAELDDVADFLRYVLGGDPDDSAAAAMLGSSLTTTGWNIRSGLRAQHVSQDQFRVFHEWLRRAEQVLIEAAARTPEDPAVWVARLTSARGLELGLAEVRRRYDRLCATDPHHLPGQVQLLQSLCPKWSGTWEQVHTFAREAMLAAPAGSPHALLVTEGHIEHFLDLDTVQEQHRYLADDAVRAEIVAAADRSVRHPEFRREWGWVGAAGNFAFLFGEMGDHASAAPMFGLLGTLAEKTPWNCYPGDPSAVVRERRALAQKAVR